MKDLFNAILRLKVKVALFFYFKKIRVYGKENLPKNKAVLIVANHQNALIDPLLIATQTKLKPYFLTRASVFKKDFVAKLLDFIRMIPVYRVRDGKENMGKNAQTFDRSVEILKQKGSVLVFVEGNHSLNRNLRPLRKGFARIAYQALEDDPDLDLVILPIGINYSNHRYSGSRVGMYIGKPFSPKENFPDFDPLLTKTYQALSPLVTSIPDQNYEKDLETLLEHNINLTDPKLVEQFLSSDSQEKAPGKKRPYFSNKVMKVFHFPLFALWLSIQGKIKDSVFFSTFKFVIGFVLAPVWYLILLIVFPLLGWGDWSLPWLFLSLVYLLANTREQA